MRKITLVTCPCAFRLRSLARSDLDENPLRSPSGLVEILVTSSLVQVLPTRSCADPAEILSEVLA